MTTGALQGLLYCGNILIPSLFPFMVLSTFIVKSGIADALGKFLSPVTKRLFHTDGSVGVVILLGLTGGFPVGAKGVATLYSEKKINIETARALSMFLVGGGPGFVIFVVGGSLYNNIFTGLLLWISQIITQLILGIWSCRHIKYIPQKITKEKRLPISNSIVESTQSGVNGIISLCGLVIIFSCIFGICEEIHLTEMVSDILTGIGLPESISNSVLSVLWEVTKGCNTCCDNAVPVWLTSFALGWGGVCVHFQIYSLITQINSSKIKFTLYRLVQGVVSAIITAIIFIFYNPEQNVYSNTSAQHANISCNNCVGSIALIAMCILFTMCIETNKEKS